MTSNPSAGAPKIAAYEIGQVVGAVAARYETNQTSPPDRFDMATILDAMLEADKFAENDADKKVLRQVEGLGTSRTRQAIVDGLVAKQLLSVTAKKKRHILTPTSMAEQLRDRVPPLLGSVAMTAKWELAFEMIERGKVQWTDVADKAFDFATGLVNTAKEQKGSFVGVPVSQSAGGAGGVGRRPLQQGGASSTSTPAPRGYSASSVSSGQGRGSGQLTAQSPSRTALPTSPTSAAHAPAAHAPRSSMSPGARPAAPAAYGAGVSRVVPPAVAPSSPPVHSAHSAIARPPASKAPAQIAQTPQARPPLPFGATPAATLGKSTAVNQIIKR